MVKVSPQACASVVVERNWAKADTCYRTLFPFRVKVASPSTDSHQVVAQDNLLTKCLCCLLHHRLCTSGHGIRQPATSDGMVEGAEHLTSCIFEALLLVYEHVQTPKHHAIKLDIEQDLQHPALRRRR